MLRLFARILGIEGDEDRLPPEPRRQVTPPPEPPAENEGPVYHPIPELAINGLTSEQPLPFQVAVEENDAVTPPGNPAWMKSKSWKDLMLLLSKHPYLTNQIHYLNAQFAACAQAISEKNNGEADRIRHRLEEELDLEHDAVEVLYEFFKTEGSDGLKFAEIKRMLKYLGLPSEKTDVAAIFDTLDHGGEFTLLLESFRVYAASMGGSLKLLEMRKSESLTINSNSLLGPDETYADVAGLAKQLEPAGFDAKEILSWRLMLPVSEARAVAEMKPCQTNALRHIRLQAKQNHQRALFKLNSRFRQLGYEKDDLWMTLAWIRECAPIIVQVDLDKFMAPMNIDTHYRNQFETECSGGLMDMETRRKWETNLFKGAYDGPEVTAFDRVKYGVLNVMYDHRGVARTEIYGDSYLILKDSRLRSTFSPQDSANLSSDKLAVLDYFAHELVEYTDAELKEVVKVATSPEPIVGDSCVVNFLKYKEAQVHGEIHLSKHVQRLVAHDRHRTGFQSVFLAEVAAKHGFELCWSGDEKARMERERQRSVSPVNEHKKAKKADKRRPSKQSVASKHSERSHTPRSPIERSRSERDGEEGKKDKKEKKLKKRPSKSDISEPEASRARADTGLSSLETQSTATQNTMTTTQTNKGLKKGLSGMTSNKS